MEHPFPAYEGDDAFFFVSYAHRDADVIFPEMSWIRDAGFNLWYDDGIHVGAVWRRVLAQSLSQSSGLIFFCTSHSAVSDNCLKEINFALDQGKEVLVIQLDDSPLPLELQLSLNDRQALIKTKLDEQTYRDRLRTALSRLVSNDAVKVNEPSQPSRKEREEWTLLLTPLQGQGNQEVEMIAQDLTHDLKAVIANRYWIFRHRLSGEPTNDPNEIIVGGLVRQRGPNLRITVQVHYCNEMVWSQNFERPVENFWEVQDHVVNEIASTLHHALVPSINRRYEGVADDDLDVVGLAARSYEQRFSVVDRSSRDRSLGLARRMVALAPEFAQAHALLAGLLDYITYMNLTRRPEETSAEAVAEIDKAIALAPNDPFSLNVGATIHLRYGMESLGLKLGERSTEILGAPQEGHLSALIYAGRTAEMLAFRAQINSLTSHAGAPPFNLLALAHTLEGYQDAALEAAQDYVGALPQFFLAWVVLANQLALAGQFDEARQAIARVRQMVPGWTIELQEKGSRLTWRNNERVVEAACGGLNLLKA